jgi:hypothetical protein
MRQSARDPAHTITLKIRLSETLRQQLLSEAAGEPFNRVIVERLEAGSSLSDVNLAPVGLPTNFDALYDAAVKTLTTQEWRLARQYHDLNATIRALLRAAMMLAPESTFFRSVTPRSAAHRSLGSARDKIRRALDIILELQQAMADHAPTDAEAVTAAAPFPDRSSPVADTTSSDDLGSQSGRPLEERDSGSLVEVKIRLPEALRQRLAAQAARNKRTLTAEIRTQLELSCAVKFLESEIDRRLAEIVLGAAERVLSLQQWRIRSTADRLQAVIDALETAQAVLNPLSGLLPRVRSTSSAARELEDTRSQIRAALLAIQTLAPAEGPAKPLVLLGAGASVPNRQNSKR